MALNLSLAVVALALATLLGFLSRYSWIFDLASHLRVQYLVASAACGVTAVATGDSLSAVTCVIVLIVNAAVVSPQVRRTRASRSADVAPSSSTHVDRIDATESSPDAESNPPAVPPTDVERATLTEQSPAADRGSSLAPTPNSNRAILAARSPDAERAPPSRQSHNAQCVGPSNAHDAVRTLRVFFANTLEINNAFERVARAIVDAAPDVVVLAEVDDGAMAALRARLPEYPFHEQMTEGSRPWGIGLFSLSAPDVARIVDLEESGSPLIIARFGGEVPITVIGVHPTPPYRPKWFAQRNAYLSKLAHIVRVELESKGGDVVVVGDFNITPWSVHYSRFLEAAGLRNARAGFGLQTTWPTFFPPFLRIPIDHCLISHRLTVTSHTVGRRTGSDHFPIIVDITQ